MADERKVATLSLDGKEYHFPVLSPTAGPDVVDIRKLYADAGVFTYDDAPSGMAGAKHPTCCPA